MPRVGYARVSKGDQNPELQLNALNEAGCERIYTEHASGAKTDRPELVKALDYVRAGDTLVVWKLDRLGRSLKHLITVVSDLGERGVGFVSLTEGMDTTTAQGKLLFHVFGAFAEFERELIRERSLAGLAIANANGRHGGRPRVLTPQQAAKVAQRYANGERVSDLAKIFECGRATIYRAIESSAA